MKGTAKRQEKQPDQEEIVVKKKNVQQSTLTKNMYKGHLK